MKFIVLLTLCLMAFAHETAAETTSKVIEDLDIKDTVFELSDRVSSFKEIFDMDTYDLSGKEKTALGFMAGFLFATVDDGVSLDEAQDSLGDMIIEYSEKDPTTWVQAHSKSKVPDDSNEQTIVRPHDEDSRLLAAPLQWRPTPYMA